MVSAAPSRDSVIRLRDGRALAYAEWGDLEGQPIVALHGMPGSRLFCPDVEATVAAGVRLFTLDRPGYGGSDPHPGRTMLDWVDDFVAFVDQLGLPPCPLVGWSSGGPYALACAVGAPARVTDVCLAASDAPFIGGTPAWDELSPGGRDLITAVRRDPLGSIEAVRSRTDWYATDWARIIPPADPDAEPAEDDPDANLRQRPDVRQGLSDMFREGARRGADGFTEDWIALVSPWGFELADVRPGVRIWWGDADRLTSRATTEQLISSLPDPVVTIAPDEGHLVLVTHWREILGV